MLTVIFSFLVSFFVFLSQNMVLYCSFYNGFLVT